MTTQETRSRFFEVKKAMADLLDGAKAEERALTDAENAQLEQLRSELNGINISLQTDATQQLINSLDSFAPKGDQGRNLRFAEAVMDAYTKHAVIEVEQHRALDARADVAGATPLTIGEIIEPLEKGNILGMLGCHIQTGLFGDWKYPVVAAIEAEVAGESAEISDKKLDITAVEPTPHRVALSILVTKSAINATNEELKNIVLKQIVLGLDRLMNKWMFGTTAVATNVNGLFVSPGTSQTAASTSVFTYAEIMALKGAVDATGVKPDNTAAFVMSNATKALLEATPKASGGDSMICEDGKINGVPVYVTEYCPAGTIEFGYFSYALVGQFDKGGTTIVVDPFTKATSNSVRFILNTDMDIKAARAQAFGKLVLHS